MFDVCPNAMAAARWHEARQREAQAAAEAEARREREQRRRTMLAEARHAAAVAGADRDDPLISFLCRDVIELTVAEPTIATTWLHKSAPARQVMAGQGVSFTSRGAIACAPITSVPDYAVVLHEIGHQRAEQTGTTLEREIAAWAWAHQHARAWNDAAEARMKDALGSYVVGAQQDQRPDLFGLTLAGVFLGEYRPRKWPSESELRVEAETLFAERYPSAGARPCQSRLCLRERARPVRYVGMLACCATCAPLEEARQQIHAPEERRRREMAARMTVRDLRLEIERADAELRGESHAEEGNDMNDIENARAPFEVADGPGARSRSATALRGIRRLKEAAGPCRYCSRPCVSTANVCTSARCVEIHEANTRDSVRIKLLKEARARAGKR